MVIHRIDDKNLKVPRSLGNFNNEGTGGGMTPQEVQQMIDASLEDYTLTDNFATINDQPITEGGNIQISGGTGSVVTVEQVLSAGTKIATVTVDGTPTDLYAPQGGGGGGVTPQEVEDMIQSAITVDVQPQIDSITADTASLDTRVTDLENASSDYATTADTATLASQIAGKQDQLTAGQGISIVNNVISATGQPGPAPSGDTALKAVIYHEGTEEDPFTQADIAQLQAFADAISGVTDGDFPQAYVDLITDGRDDVTRFYLSYGWMTEEEEGGPIVGGTYTFVSPQEDGYTATFTLDFEDVSNSYFYWQDGYEGFIEGYVDANVQPQIDTLTGETADLDTRVTALEQGGAGGDIVYVDINDSDVYGAIDSAVGDGKMVVLVGTCLQNEYPDELQVYLTYSRDASYQGGATGYVFDGVQSNDDGTSVRTYHVEVKSDGTFVGTVMDVNTRRFAMKGYVRNYTLPTATANGLGGVKIGSGITVAQDGTISVSGGGGSSDPGYKWIDYDDYTNNWTQAEKEAWYDEVADGYFNSGNTKFGVVKLIDKGYPNDDPTRSPYCSYAVLTLYNLESGFDSLQFQQTCAGGVSGNQVKVRTARVQRGGGFDYWEETLDGPRTGENVRKFKFTTALQPATYDYYYFDAYLFCRSFVEPSGENDYYGHASYGAIQIIDDQTGQLLSVANVQTACEMPSLYPDDMNVRVYFTYFLGGELYDAVIDVLFQNGGPVVNVIKNVPNYLLNNWVGTQAEYNAIGAGNYDPNLIYHIDR